MYQRFIKRILDVVIASLFVILFWWLYLLLAFLVWKYLGSPVVFRQDRPGKDEKIFKLYKFRTMTDERDESGNLLPDDVRLTKFGKFLRSTSLDELPEIFNIIKGDMSIVGPRPLLCSYLPYYTAEERKRHYVRPGLTGLAQVEGRNYLPWEDRFSYDIEYVNSCSFLMDLKIIIKTVMIVLKRKGVADRTQIGVDSNGKRYIIVNGKKQDYPSPLNIERGGM